MSGLAIGEHELRELVVDRLEALSATDFSRAVALAHHRRVPLERAVAEQAKLPFGLLLQEVARSWNVPFVDLEVADVREDALTLVREDFARARLCIAYAATPTEVEVAMANPRDGGTIDEIARVTGRRVHPRLANVGAIRRAQLLYRTRLFRLLARAGETDAGTAGLAGPQDARVADVLTRILEYAVVTGASDVHIEPFEFDAVVRCRIDGVLHEVLTPVPAVAQALVARIKTLGSMRVEDRRTPQEGRFEADLSGVSVDLRASTLPTAWGEKAVIRVRPRDAAPLDLESLGLARVDRGLLTGRLSRGGLILAAGPAGAGKTSTLYSLLMRVGADRRTAVNLATIEDPVERTLPRVNQVAVNIAAGLDFAHGLRALLRQDPDVVLVGEIRDRETADMTVRAALVGRQLFAGLHAHDAASAVTRLLDLGVEPYLLASTLSLVVAQRLVRRLCPDCRERHRPDAQAIDVLRAGGDGGALARGLLEYGVIADADDWPARVELFRAAGCAHCRFTGYRGRVGLFELLPMTEALRRPILQRSDAGALRTAALAAGMRALAVDGVAKVITGETSLDEVFRAAV